ncbi:hypothetical protein AU191_18410 [Mycolicibacterium acapulense]|nr:hypothetical protein AU191_18410 [Mycolicibacterium acapulense]
MRAVSEHRTPRGQGQRSQIAQQRTPAPGVLIIADQVARGRYHTTRLAAEHYTLRRSREKQ